MTLGSSLGFRWRSRQSPRRNLSTGHFHRLSRLEALGVPRELEQEWQVVEPITETHEVLEKLARQGDPDIAAELASMGVRVRDIVPDCVGLSLALLHEELTLTLVASSEEIAALDAVQYLDGGPCVEAAHTDRIVDVSTYDLLSEERWQMYAQATTAAGVASSLTVPILRNGRVVGTVNLYAARPTSFVGHHEALAVALGGTAELAITNADLSFRTRLEAAQAPTRLADQDDVDIAVSIITAHDEVDTGTARERIRLAAARAGLTDGQAARAVRRIYRP